MSAASEHADLIGGGVTAIAARVRGGELSSRELVSACLAQAAALDDLNTHITVAENAAERAGELDRQLAERGPVGPLHGVPVSVKDNYTTSGIRTTGGMAVLRDWIPDTDAAVVQRLTDAGAIVLGKTNMHECSFGITSDNPHFGPVRNPHDPTRSAGGSSGGSGAAVAARIVPAAMGTDTGGSVRIPAAVCGAVGLKPTHGRLPLEGVLRVSAGFDVAGPITRDVTDAALMMHVLTGGETVPPGELPTDPAALRGVRIGVPVGDYWADNHPEVERLHRAAAQRFADAGAELREVTVEHAEIGSETGFLIVSPESVVLVAELFRERGLGSVEERLGSFGADVAALLGSQVGPNASPVPAHAYLTAVGETVPAIRRGYLTALSDVDVLLSPTTPSPAIPLAQSGRMEHNGSAVDPFPTFSRYTFGASVVGLPAISVPAGLTGDGLPVGVQLIGAHHAESTLLRLARAFELTAG
ncbi:aspartyl-tRNA(Asn)/glutamyl-tRNA(Gln) amidotransferase subunit A/mandelamide amidase [Saccharopolyspora antimicrobica]|uniref:Aspartyl-tRNA(Asn)/glutamyl-tRNA(Gln) amidotransferase subunit A/mandelamide amidase n=1 Tax=Saccharopolyspora antimicrobica TaxID=455193 RepID=A0A1I4S384_9PSEU|nr:amidase family protein [Saccharopolyspora antimicrobica]RKT87560.1 aspartyl-tRNA(Asn)/glutamyl-tRNA(Gln) amidotransferase subunit A/mandelamide amidase [Saccharopolyspora antimicrobica]SFM58764.1 aspartyl-tRNA(Asn)/glutamyl-tRNA(Gln) amidotransferase subunit A/mandelamide amidase [Saccharopolyspora antimicrobica]